MVRKRYYLVLLLGLILLFQSCMTDDASFDAVVIGPNDLAGFKFQGTGVDCIASPAGDFSTTGPLVFQVQKSSTDPTPVANANVRIDVGSGGNVNPVLLDRTGTTCYSGSPIPDIICPLGIPTFASPPGPDCSAVDTQTDQLGVVQFKVKGQVFFGCGTGASASTEDIATEANAQVTISAAAKGWKMPITITCTSSSTTTTT